MDEIAQRYLLLTLRLARHAPEMLDFYVGPPELQEAVAGEDPTLLAELHAEALQLQERVADLPGIDGPDARRKAWLTAQLTAHDALSRLLDGEEIGYVDAVEALFAIPVEAEPASSFETAHRLLQDVLPAGPSLRDRLAAHDEATQLAPEKVVAVTSAIADELRLRARKDFWLPDGEGVEFVDVRDQWWSAYAWYRGRLRTRIELNLDRPTNLGVAVMLAAHEAYPGHHAERATKEAVLVGDQQRHEATIGWLYAPEATISEGLADLARDVVLNDQELATLLRRTVHELGIQLDHGVVEREAAVERARITLRNATPNAAIALHRDRLPATEVRDYLVEQGLYTDERIERTMALAGDPHQRYFVLTYMAGARLIGQWLEVQGQTDGFSRLLAEQLTPELLRAEIGEPPALYPADFV
jgi:hypothetical protein